MGAVVAVSGDGHATLAERAAKILKHRGKPETARTKNGTVCIFDGQIFNAGALADELGLRHDDVPLLLAEAFERIGTKLFDRLDGPFALAFTTADGTLTAARDPLGEKPLYHTTINDSLMIASEIKAFLAHPKFKPRPNLASLNKLMV